MTKERRSVPSELVAVSGASDNLFEDEESEIVPTRVPESQGLGLDLDSKGILLYKGREPHTTEGLVAARLAWVNRHDVGYFCPYSWGA